MNHWAILAIAIVSEVIATSALKGSEGFTRLLPSSLVVIGYGISFYCLAIVLKTLPVGIAYAVWSGAGIVLVTGVAWLIYGQKLDFWAYIGIGFIVLGVLILNLLSKSSAH